MPEKMNSLLEHICKAEKVTCWGERCLHLTQRLHSTFYMNLNND